MPVVYILMEHGPALDLPNYRARYVARGMEGDILCAAGAWGARLDTEIASAGARRPHDRPPFVRRVRGHRAPRAPARAGVESVVGTGVVTNLCVQTTIQHAFALGYYVVVAEDATAAADPTVQAVTLDNFRQYFGPVVPSETIDRRWAAAHDSRVPGRRPGLILWRTRWPVPCRSRSATPSSPAASATSAPGCGAAPLDALLVVAAENITYLTGYETIGYSNFGVLVVRQDAEPAPVHPGDGAHGRRDDDLAPRLRDLRGRPGPARAGGGRAPEARLAGRARRRGARRVLRLAGGHGPVPPPPGPDRPTAPASWRPGARSSRPRRSR